MRIRYFSNKSQQYIGKVDVKTMSLSDIYAPETDKSFYHTEHFIAFINYFTLLLPFPLFLIRRCLHGGIKHELAVFIAN